MTRLPGRVAVIGGGKMGAVPARVLAEAGCEVALHVRTPRAGRFVRG